MDWHILVVPSRGRFGRLETRCHTRMRLMLASTGTCLLATRFIGAPGVEGRKSMVLQDGQEFLLVRLTNILRDDRVANMWWQCGEAGVEITREDKVITLRRVVDTTSDCTPDLKALLSCARPSRIPSKHVGIH